MAGRPHANEEAIELANDTEYGLVAYVYSGDLARGPALASALRLEWWASTAALSLTLLHRSAGSRTAVSAEKVESRDSWPSPNASTSRSVGDMHR